MHLTGPASLPNGIPTDPSSCRLLPPPSSLTQYTFKLLPGQQPLKLKTSLTTGPANGIHVTVHQRRQGVSTAAAAEE